MNDGDNRFNPGFLRALLEELDRIESNTDARTLVVTSSHQKIFSNGIDLEWLTPVVEQGDMEQAKAFFYLLNELLRRTLTYPMVTVAAINGHAFAGGAIWACAFDFRFMRSDRGFFCLPEVDLGIPFLPGMNAILKKAIPMHRLETLQLTGMRMTADQCASHRMIVKSCHVDDLMRETMAFAREQKKARAVVKELKARLYKSIVHELDVSDRPYIESGHYHIDLGQGQEMGR
jgi:enoyl-CoA hydratase/carnithine racemase